MIVIGVANEQLKGDIVSFNPKTYTKDVDIYYDAYEDIAIHKGDVYDVVLVKDITTETLKVGVANETLADFLEDVNITDDRAIEDILYEQGVALLLKINPIHPASFNETKMKEMVVYGDVHHIKVPSGVKQSKRRYLERLIKDILSRRDMWYDEDQSFEKTDLDTLIHRWIKEELTSVSNLYVTDTEMKNGDKPFEVIYQSDYLEDLNVWVTIGRDI